MTKQIVTASIEQYSITVPYVLDNRTPDEVCEYMQKVKEEYKGRDIYFYTYSPGYDGGYELELFERRLETDKEYNDRLKAEEKIKLDKKKAAAKKEEKERKELARLQAKYGV